MQFCTNVDDLPEVLTLNLALGMKKLLLSDPIYIGLSLDTLLLLAREKGWTLEKIQRTVGTKFDRATIIALIKGDTL